VFKSSQGTELTTGSISLNAWPLTYPQTKSYESIRLPAPAVRISAQKNQVGIVTTTHQVLIWSIGGALISVDPSAVHEFVSDFSIKQGLVVFHPLEEKCFYVIYEAWPRHLTSAKVQTNRVVAQEFIGGAQTMTKLLDLHLSTAEPLDLTGLLHDGVVGIHKNFLAQLWTTSESDTNEYQTNRRSGQTGPNDIHHKVFTVVTFDIYQRKFDLQEYCLSTRHPDQLLKSAFYWRNQVFFPVYGKPSEDKHSNQRMYLRFL
jgi:hypothetical protein